MPNSVETQIPKKLGRKPIHASPAARAAAYRARKAEKIAEALAQVAAPDTTELEAVKAELDAVKEDLHFTQNEKNELHSKLTKEELKADKLRAQVIRLSAVKPEKITRASETDRYRALRKFFVTGYYPKPDDAKRLRVNTKKAAGAANELLGVLKSMDIEIRESIAADFPALVSAAAILHDYGKLLEDAQESAESMKLKKIRDQEKEHAAQVKTTIDEMFPNLETRNQEALQIAQDLLTFEKEGEAWLMAKHRVDGANAYLESSTDMKNAVLKNNAARIAQLVAEQKMRMPRKGRSYPYREETHWSPCWGDFEEWRNRK